MPASYALNQILTLFAVMVKQRAPVQLKLRRYRPVSCQEESHLHDGIDAGAKSTFAGDFAALTT